MPADLIRDAPLGQIIRVLTRGKYFAYPEERSDFICPPQYMLDGGNQLPFATNEPSTATNIAPEKTQELSEDARQNPNRDLSRQTTPRPSVMSDAEKEDVLDGEKEGTQGDVSGSDEITAFQGPSADVELAVARTRSVPKNSPDGTILVEWYTTDDPANPQNWSMAKKNLVALNICLYTFTIYCASSLYVPSEQGVMERFGVSHAAAALGLALYVLAYGIGPLLFAPLSEIPIIGRNPVYFGTFAIFVILSLPTALVDNFGGLLVLRFLQGFFGSPCLANGGASMSDMYPFIQLPYLMTAWVVAIYSGPALGPTLSAFAVQEENWRWSLWVILLLSGPMFLFLFVCTPETSTPTILLHRARRLRKLTGNPKLRSQSEIDQHNIHPRDIVVNALVKPLEITIKDPAVGFTNLYTALVYGIYYSFFEVFPLVFPVDYGFNLGETGVLFLCVFVGCFLGVIIYLGLYRYVVVPEIKKNGIGKQENSLLPGLPAVFWVPIGLFMFGWTARSSIHWIVPTIGIVIYGAAVFIVVQAIFIYLPMTYPRYAASLFAANDAFRSMLAAGAVIFARPLYTNLGVGRGISVLGGCSVLGIIGMFGLYWYGESLRRRSKFTG